MEQLQALKNRFALIDSVSSPKQPERTPSQTTPTVEEHHFMMLRTLRQSLTLFYEVTEATELAVASCMVLFVIALPLNALSHLAAVHHVCLMLQRCWAPQHDRVSMAGCVSGESW